MKTTKAANNELDAINYILLVVILLLAAVLFAGCDSKNATTNSSENATASVSPSAAPTAEPSVTPTTEPTAFPTAEPTAVPTEKPTEEPTAIPTEEPTAVPTEEPTPEPTAEPSPAPTESPIEKQVIDYGDVTQYLNMSIGETIALINKEYEYAPGVAEFYYFGASDLILFSPEVSFMFSRNGYSTYDENADPATVDRAAKTLVVGVSNYQYPDRAKKNLGNGLDSSMTFSQVSAVIGDDLGVVDLSDGESVPGSILRFKGYSYLIYWDGDPKVSDASIASVFVSKTAIDWILRNIVSIQINDMLEKDQAAISDRTEQYLTELRAAFKSEPVQQTSLYTSFSVDECTTVDVYEVAAYGRPAAFDPDTKTITGIDTTKECFRHSLIAVTKVDGEPVATEEYPIDVRTDDGAEILCNIYTLDSFRGDSNFYYLADLNPFRDLSVPKKDGQTVVTKVSVNSTDVNGYIVTDNTAYYANSKPEAILSDSFVTVISNNGYRTDEKLIGPDGKNYAEISDSDITRWNGLSAAGEGTLTRGSVKVDWKKLSLTDGITVLTANSLSEHALTAEFLIVGDCFVPIVAALEP